MLCKTRMEFRIAITATPTSANTAAHILAMPAAPRISISPLTPRAKNNILFNNFQRSSGNTDDGCYFHRIVIHKNHIGGFNGGI